MLKKITLLLIGLTLAALAACSASGIGGPEKEKPSAEVNMPLTLDSLKVVFKDGNTPLLVFQKEKTSYMVQTTEGESGLVLEYEAPENVNIEITPPQVQNYSAAGDGMTTDGMVDLVLDNLPVPRKDPDFEVIPTAGVDSYSIMIALTLKDGAPASIREGDTIYNYQPSTYMITIREPPSNIDSEENKAKVNEKINEATQKINNLGLVVGNPADNDPSVDYITTLVNELNTLKEGTLEDYTYETRVKPDEGAIYTEEVRLIEGTNQTVYIVSDTRPVYDYMEILTKAKQLNTALENSNVAHIIVKKLELAYKAPVPVSDPNVQKIEIGSNGKYKIEIAGGSGGHVWTGNNDTATGGRAAKVTATFTFNKDQKLGFRIGGEGIGTADLAIIANPAYTNAAARGTAMRAKWNNNKNTWLAAKPGGWNGGGDGGQGYDDNPWVKAPGSGGGGATDVRIYSGDSLSSTWTYDNNDPRIMVAGGGGGSAQGANQHNAMMGGHAGVAGRLFVSSTRSSSSSTVIEQVTSETGYAYENWSTDPQAPGSSSYTKTASPVGDRGVNGNSGDYHEGRGGGGGGFKGGEAATARVFRGIRATAVGAGGSSHVKSTAHNKTITLRNDQFGNGYAKIEWIEE